MREFSIFLSSPDVTGVELAYVEQVFESGQIGNPSGTLAAFEAQVAAQAGRCHAVAVSSGTAALHVSLVALGVTTGDVVICSTFTFVATANAILYAGATPVFVDSDPESGNMSPALLESSILGVQAAGKRVGAVIPVDFLGKCADYTQIEAVCSRFGIPVISDAAESLGAFHNARPAGSFGLAGIFSFNTNKIATTTGGGMVVTDDRGFAERVRFLANQAKEKADYYEHREVGFNYRMSNVLAAVGRGQLDRLGEMIARRREIRRRYVQIVSEVGAGHILGNSGDGDNCWLSALIVSADADWRPADLQEALAKAGIESRRLWKPMHLQPLFEQHKKYVDGSSSDLFDRGLALPSGSNLTETQWGLIEKSLKNFVSGA